MLIVEAMRRSGIAVPPDRPIRDVATIMERSGIGCVVVVDGDVPVGIVTDRDIVRRGIAGGRPMDGRIDSVMTSPVVTIDADMDRRKAYGVFRTHGIRRLVAVRDGAFLGVISLDDLLVELVDSLVALTRPVTAELLFAHREAPVPVLQ